MAIRDLTSERLYVTASLGDGARLTLSDDQAHYLLHVLRMKVGDRVLVFNGREGEWSAEISSVKKRSAELQVIAQTRSQSDGPDIDYLFAPLKRARLDYMVQKATEMGVARLRPVITARTVPERINLERMAANAVEAAEQCGILRVPEVLKDERLDDVLDAWPAGRQLIFCDEAHSASGPIATLADMQPGPLAVLIGPEGGFTDNERSRLLAQKFVVPITLGPRIMRADTAAVAVLALVNAVLGDWRAP